MTENIPHHTKIQRHIMELGDSHVCVLRKEMRVNYDLTYCSIVISFMYREHSKKFHLHLTVGVTATSIKPSKAITALWADNQVKSKEHITRAMLHYCS